MALPASEQLVLAQAGWEEVVRQHQTCLVGSFILPLDPKVASTSWPQELEEGLNERGWVLKEKEYAVGEKEQLEAQLRLQRFDPARAPLILASPSPNLTLLESLSSVNVAPLSLATLEALGLVIVGGVARWEILLRHKAEGDKRIEELEAADELDEEEEEELNLLKVGRLTGFVALVYSNTFFQSPDLYNHTLTSDIATPLHIIERYPSLLAFFLAYQRMRDLGLHDFARKKRGDDKMPFAKASWRVLRDRALCITMMKALEASSGYLNAMSYLPNGALARLLANGQDHALLYLWSSIGSSATFIERLTAVTPISLTTLHLLSFSTLNPLYLLEDVGDDEAHPVFVQNGQDLAKELEYLMSQVDSKALSGARCFRTVFGGTRELRACALSHPTEQGAPEPALEWSKAQEELLGVVDVLKRGSWARGATWEDRVEFPTIYLPRDIRKMNSGQDEWELSKQRLETFSSSVLLPLHHILLNSLPTSLFPSGQKMLPSDYTLTDLLLAPQDPERAKRFFQEARRPRWPTACTGEWLTTVAEADQAKELTRFAARHANLLLAGAMLGGLLVKLLNEPVEEVPLPKLLDQLLRRLRNALPPLQPPPATPGDTPEDVALQAAQVAATALEVALLPYLPCWNMLVKRSGVDSLAHLNQKGRDELKRLVEEVLKGVQELYLEFEMSGKIKGDPQGIKAASWKVIRAWLVRVKEDEGGEEENERQGPSTSSSASRRGSSPFFETPPSSSLATSVRHPSPALSGRRSRTPDGEEGPRQDRDSPSPSLAPNSAALRRRQKGKERAEGGNGVDNIASEDDEEAWASYGEGSRKRGRREPASDGSDDEREDDEDEPGVGSPSRNGAASSSKNKDQETGTTSRKKKKKKPAVAPRKEPKQVTTKATIAVVDRQREELVPVLDMLGRKFRLWGNCLPFLLPLVLRWITSLEEVPLGLYDAFPPKGVALPVDPDERLDLIASHPIALPAWIWQFFHANDPPSLPFLALSKDPNPAITRTVAALPISHLPPRQLPYLIALFQLLLVLERPPAKGVYADVSRRWAAEVGRMAGSGTVEGYFGEDLAVQNDVSARLFLQEGEAVGGETGPSESGGGE